VEAMAHRKLRSVSLTSSWLKMQSAVHTGGWAIAAAAFAAAALAAADTDAGSRVRFAVGKGQRRCAVAYDN